MTRMHRKTTETSWLVATALALVIVPSLVTASQAPTQPPAPKPSKPQVVESNGKLPLSFEANKGHTDSQVQFLAHGRGYTLFLAQNEAVFALRAAGVESVESVGSVPGKEQSSELRAELSKRTQRAQPTKQAVLRMRLEGANPSPRASGLEPLPGIVNYFIGNDPKKWRTNIPTYQKVEYKNMYPGIDLVYYGNQGKLEYDFVVSPGADPDQIKLAFEGAENPRLADNGDVTFTVSGADLYLQKPLVYQQDEKGRKQLVAGNYILLNTDLPRTSRLTRREPLGRATLHVAFQVASYDRTRPLIIDPVLAYSTYLGGSGVDIGSAIAVDGNRNVYVTGRTSSADFTATCTAPCTVLDDVLGSAEDAFVTKLNAAGSALVYSTYLGGNRDDDGNAIAVDAAGNAYVTGLTLSATFPTTTGAFDVTCGTTVLCSTDRGDAFVAKLDAAGSALLYSTYLGGVVHDQGNAIAVDATGSVYVTGATGSSDFPTTTGAFQEADENSTDAFVTKLNPDGSGLVYSTYLGGFSIDEGHGIVVDSTGSAYVTGFTNIVTSPLLDPPFPTFAAFQPDHGGSDDAFVTKLNAAGSGLVYSTYLGGGGLDRGLGIALDANGEAYVTGLTTSSNFPLAPTTGAFDDTCGTVDPCAIGVNDDAFVTKLNATGSALLYSTYLGSDGFDEGIGIAVDTTGSAYVTGLTGSGNFPTQDAIQAGLGGGFDAFVTKLNAAGSALAFSTYLGGDGNDEGNGIAVDTTGSAYVTGTTNPPILTPFPTTLGSSDTLLDGTDAFVTKLGQPNTPAGADVTIQDGPVTLTFATITAAGDTTITTSAAGPAPPAGFRLGAPPTYYDLSTTAQFSGSVRICIDFTDIAFGNKASLRLFHFGNPGGWENVTVTNPPPPANTICGVVTSLSPFAILEPENQAQAFATFRPEVEIELARGANNDAFEVEAFFSLGAGAGIAPLTEDLTLQVGPYSTTIPAGSFKEKKGRFKFKGVIDGVRLAARIKPLSRGGFKFEAEGKCANLNINRTDKQVTVELSIGDDSGSATVRAEIESSRKGGRCGVGRDDDEDNKHDKHDKDDDDD